MAEWGVGANQWTFLRVATRRDLETGLIEKCWEDPEFKRKVLSDPKGMLEEHTGQKLPLRLKIFIHLGGHFKTGQ